MRYFIPILFLLLALLSLLTWFNQAERASPTQEAIAFLTDIQAGNLTKIVQHFGGNTCRCPARNGWGAFLSYQPGQETNLAFLLGHSFSIGKPLGRKIASPPQAKYAGPWETPEDYIVDVPLVFNSKQYSPFFLPLPLAYGENMTWHSLQDFIKNPSAEAAKGFSLRLRPGLAPGAIKFDTSTITPNVVGNFKFLWPASRANKNNKSENKHADYNEKITAILAQSIKKSDNKYMTPKDAGPVIMPDGSTLSLDKLAEILPRLKSTNIRLHVVRRGKMQPWTIFHFLLQNSIVEDNNGKNTEIN